MGHMKASTQQDITRRGRALLHLRRSLINIFQKPVAWFSLFIFTSQSRPSSKKQVDNNAISFK